jgi:hypothetical protein
MIKNSVMYLNQKGLFHLKHFDLFTLKNLSFVKGNEV